MTQNFHADTSLFKILSIQHLRIFIKVFVELAIIIDSAE